ncbi:LodA/GoxA family CTQ-dependent oxidase [Aestuariicoccus sp. MJ-SS9]|uniref:LodA/GoxA family CTQ-dependent oxidase n=1 Tax=Aestuariicoccus sp. MJ-SS9 TaxID=3079855 RepID=UPI002914CD9C|nr:LodA/GoxA family CTQ-dependent oxidase [Aestuariicoccus sp. MJ-SS9]MDU8910758.1 LodA/GoxA family CTQ-dependent oxidase [Aestuariicoccus sp. MJ-SS9]
MIDGNYPAYLERHPKVQHILNEMEKAEASCLTASYWSTLPFALGEGFVKYRIVPVDAAPGEPVNDTNYLAEDLSRRLLEGDAKFAFQVQERQGDEPLDKATERWSGPWQTVATLTLPQQDIEARGQASYGEHLAFNIWRTPESQEPQGSIAAARRVVYQGSADQRRQANGIALDEPRSARDPAPAPVADDDCIVSAAIYPPIGVMRVGNAPDGYYVGPEVTHPLPEKTYRDDQGRLLREAARFRVYGLNAKGTPIKELTAENAQIEWRVELANQKSSWYQFQLAMDIPEFADAPPSLQRNADVGDRASLTIAPSRQKISGCNADGPAFDDGAFLGTKVYLGELKTDEKGRLIVLGGRGHSASHDGSPAITFANNEGWHDDTSDGPVHAHVTYEGARLKVEPAWVVCAPPNYAPLIKSVRTMWDLMRDTAINAGLLARPERPSFQHDIRPIFERMTHLEWVNQGFFGGFGHNGPFNFASAEWMARLADPSPAMTETRRVLSNNFRNLDRNNNSAVPWPWLYGDAMNIPAADTPRQNAALSDLQLWMLDQWVIGNFDADYDPDYAPPRHIDEVAQAEQPDMLTRAAMEFCLADAFHPGCEMTWPMRNAGMYASAFRLKHRKPWNPEPNYGAELGTDDTSLPDGPLNGGQSPGSITRWMAVPWQTDTASCRSGYDPAYDPYLPTFWPARVPNEVMGETAAGIVNDPDAPLSERIQAFANRANWLEPLGLDKSYTHQINHMIHHFDQMGVVTPQTGPGGPFPEELQVSDQKQLDWKAPNVASAGRTAERLGAEAAPVGGVGGGAKTDLSGIEKVRRLKPAGG